MLMVNVLMFFDGRTLVEHPQFLVAGQFRESFNVSNHSNTKLYESVWRLSEKPRKFA